MTDWFWHGDSRWRARGAAFDVKDMPLDSEVLRLAATESGSNCRSCGLPRYGNFAMSCH